MVGFLYSIAIIILKFIPDYNSTAKIQFYSLISSIIGAVILLTITFDNIVIKSFNDLLMLISIGILGGSAGILFIYAYRLIESTIDKCDEVDDYIISKLKNWILGSPGLPVYLLTHPSLTLNLILRISLSLKKCLYFR